MKNYNTLNIFWFIGQKNGDNEVIAIPFIFNKNHNKIKVLTDDKIYNLNNDKFITELKTNLENNYNAKLYTFYTFEGITKKESLNLKEIEDYKYAFEMYFKNYIKARDCKELTFFRNDRYQQF